MEPELKQGYKTTEFWLALAAVIVGVVQTSGVAPEGSPWERVLGIACTALAALGYSVSRGLAKRS